MCINKLKKRRSKFAIPSCSRHLAGVVYKLRLNTSNTKYSQNVTCVCTRMSYYYRVIPEKKKEKKKEYDFNACNNVRDILYNTDIINPIVKLIVHSPVGKLV